MLLTYQVSFESVMGHFGNPPMYLSPSLFMPPSERAYSNHTVRPSVSQSVSQSVSLSVCLSVSPSVTKLVRSVTPTCLNGIWNKLVQMFTTLRRRVALKIQAHTSKVKVINRGQRSYWGHLSLYCDPTLVGYAFIISSVFQESQGIVITLVLSWQTSTLAITLKVFKQILWNVIHLFNITRATVWPRPYSTEIK